MISKADFTLLYFIAGFIDIYRYQVTLTYHIVNEYVMRLQPHHILINNLRHILDQQDIYSLTI